MHMFYLIFSFLLLFDMAFTCGVCYGSPDEPAVKAAQAGILFLLGIVGFVLSGIALFMYNLSKRSKKV
tara:strand:- start:499 stop:702 length:204 start_codon:yes stop_codon:yes gene_type:complete